MRFPSSFILLFRIVINLIGSTRPTMNFSLDDANRKIARLIARVSKEQGIQNYIHVSDLRADLNSPSEYARIKAQAEIEVLDMLPTATIVRPAPVFGPEDKLTNAYGVLQRYWKRNVAMICEEHNIAPIYAGDLAGEIMNIAVDEEGHFHGKTVEMVGPESYSHKELCDKIGEMLLLDGKYTERRVNAKIAEKILGFTDRSPRFRPMWSQEEIKMRQGRPALPSGNAVPYEKGMDTSNHDVFVVKGKENLETCGLLWLRRFREPDFLGTVSGATRLDAILDENPDAEVTRIIGAEANPTIKRIAKQKN